MTSRANQKNVLVIGKIHPDALQLLKDHGDLNITMLTDPGAPIPVSLVEQSDAVLIRYGVLSQADIRGASRLRVVSRHGVGLDNLPLDALSARGIAVTIVGPVTAVSVAEHTLAMLLSLLKKVGAYDQAVRTGNWSVRDTLAISEMAGRTLLLLGFGRIGNEVARRARAFDMRVLVHDPFVGDDVLAAASVVRVDDWRAALDRVDVLSVHLPLTPATHNIIDAGVLAAMKPTALLLNAARGGLVDEDALYCALTTHMAAGGAGIDTFVTEPPAADNPLLQLPNVVLSPHSAALSAEGARRMGMVAAGNVIAGLQGTLDPSLVVNRAALQQLAAV
jgi:D-3-phosphoglycerate dehydrogenase